jgi:hypothetical protein
VLCLATQSPATVTPKQLKELPIATVIPQVEKPAEKAAN